MLFYRAVLCFIERYDPSIPLPESGMMRDIPKWRSQKAVWVPFFVTLDMSVWDTLRAVLEADSAKQLCFQKSTASEPDDDPSTTWIATQNSEETGSCKLYWCFGNSTFPLFHVV